MTPPRRKTRPVLSRIVEMIGAGEELSGAERWVLVIIASHAGGFVSRATPGYARLAHLSGFDARSVRRLIVSCEAKGWLDVRRQERGGPQSVNEYLVTPSAEAKAFVDALDAERAARRREREARAIARERGDASIQ